MCPCSDFRTQEGTDGLCGGISRLGLAPFETDFAYWNCWKDFQMRWSQLRKRIRDGIAPELRTRIDVHCTRYRAAHDDEGEAWITVDKVKVSGGGYHHWFAEGAHCKTIDKHAAVGTHPGFYVASTDSKDVIRLQASEIHMTEHITASLFNYLNTPFDKCLNSTNPVFRAFALVNRRLGKRRLEQFRIDRGEHSLVCLFFQLRRALSHDKAFHE
jgi:hypothetical protein